MNNDLVWRAGIILRAIYSVTSPDLSVKLISLMIQLYGSSLLYGFCKLGKSYCRYVISQLWRLIFPAMIFDFVNHRLDR